MTATIIAFPSRIDAIGPLICGDITTVGPAVCMDIHTVAPAPIAAVSRLDIATRATAPIFDGSCLDIHTTASATALATKFADHFLPICQASVDLLEADERDFEARCRRMLDADVTAMIDELCGELRTVGRQMQVLVDGLELTRARLRTAMARLTVPTAS